MKWLLVLITLFYSVHGFSQRLSPGFDKEECIEMIRISGEFGNEEVFGIVPKPTLYHQIYRSEVVGLDNLWDLWMHKEHPIAVISTRGTTADSASWLANFYAAMVPAKGALKLSENETFEYTLAQSPEAAVHIGWLLSMAILSKDILPKIDSLYQEGVHDFILAGHSQGAGITYMLTAYLRQLQLAGDLPDDIQFKTYCSAGPKPGNLYFAYEYEAMTQFGWAFNVVNSADWVPEVPMSIQTTDDFNKTNPFVNARTMINAQKFPNKIVLNKVYNSLDKPTRKAQKNYQKYLGEVASQSVSKAIEGFEAPDFYQSNNYVRTGNFVVLLADSGYYAQYPNSAEKIFVHHMPLPYLYLADQLPDKDIKTTREPAEEQVVSDANSLQGAWELQFISQPLESFEDMYPGRKPIMLFKTETSGVSGFTGCNTFNGKFKKNDSNLKFIQPFALTRKYCEGMAELHFLETLKRVSTYQFSSEGHLELMSGKRVLMRLRKTTDGKE